MSGIYIRGLEIPDTCYQCIFVEDFYENPKCKISGEPMCPSEWAVRVSSKCPLIPVPDHGRLIDADALEKVMSEGIAPSVKDGGFKHPFDIIRAVANAPTIIRASEEGEG